MSLVQDSASLPTSPELHCLKQSYEKKGKLKFITYSAQVPREFQLSQFNLCSNQLLCFVIKLPSCYLFSPGTVCRFRYLFISYKYHQVQCIRQCHFRVDLNINPSYKSFAPFSWIDDNNIIFVIYMQIWSAGTQVLQVQYVGTHLTVSWYLYSYTRIGTVKSEGIVS